MIPELVAGGMMAAAGVTFSPLGGAGEVAVVLSVPALANAVNIVDGQDGLAGGLAAVAATGVTLVLAAQGHAGALGPALVASLLAFLVWNRPPAKVFLGDGGAYAVGGALALLAAGASSSWQALLGTMVCLGIFWLELCSTVVRRVVQRESLAGGDRGHVYDLLAAELSSRTRATAVMVAAGMAFATLGWVTAQVPLAVGIGIAGAAAGGGAAGVLVLWKARRSGPRHSR
jgi:UDP-N-acetylmuramyl pentapeptide phosphotransferase/UDP-N-acetylglucosamine-1-phosphate transferase